MKKVLKKAVPAPSKAAACLLVPILLGCFTPLGMTLRQSLVLGSLITVIIWWSTGWVGKITASCALLIAFRPIDETLSAIRELGGFAEPSRPGSTSCPAVIHGIMKGGTAHFDGKLSQIVSGIKSHYSAEEMVGKKVMVVTNLKPAKLAGILSEGMILCAEDADGNLSLMVPEKEMPAGAEIC